LDSNAEKPCQHHEASQGHKHECALGVVSLHRAADGFLQPRVRCPRQDNREENKAYSYNDWWNLRAEDARKHKQWPVPEIQWIADKPNEYHRSAREQHPVRPRLLSRQNHKNRAQRWHYRPHTWKTCNVIQSRHRQEEEQEPGHRQQI